MKTSHGSHRHLIQRMRSHLFANDIHESRTESHSKIERRSRCGIAASSPPRDHLQRDRHPFRTLRCSVHRQLLTLRQIHRKWFFRQEREDLGFGHWTTVVHITRSSGTDVIMESRCADHHEMMDDVELHSRVVWLFWFLNCL